MNKLIKTTLVAIAASASFIGSVSADSVSSGVRYIGDTQYAGFCNAVVKDDIRLLRVSVARNVGLVGASQREVLRTISAEDGVTCNGVSLIEFSKQRKADSVYQYLSVRS